jgi:hypothetical protein
MYASSTLQRLTDKRQDLLMQKKKEVVGTTCTPHFSQDVLTCVIRAARNVIT